MIFFFFASAGLTSVRLLFGKGGVEVAHGSPLWWGSCCLPSQFFARISSPFLFFFSPLFRSPLCFPLTRQVYIYRYIFCWGPNSSQEFVMVAAGTCLPCSRGAGKTGQSQPCYLESMLFLVFFFLGGGGGGNCPSVVTGNPRKSKNHVTN